MNKNQSRLHHLQSILRSTVKEIHRECTMQQRKGSHTDWPVFEAVLIMQFLYFLSVLTSLTFAGSYFVLFAIERKTIYEALMIRGMTQELLQCVILTFC